jgi:hypothetical protein
MYIIFLYCFLVVAHVLYGMDIAYDQIASIRIKIYDPEGAIKIIKIDNLSNLPENSPKNIAYFVSETSNYMMANGDAPYTQDSYKICDISISDEEISKIITDFGAANAIEICIRRIMSQLGKKMSLASMQNGSESFNFTSLREMYDFYKSLIESYKIQNNILSKNSTGKIGKSRTVEIGGGLI